MRTKLALMSAVLGLLLVGRVAPLVAHHAFSAEFDANKPVKFAGTVTKMQWTNPHVWVYVDVKKPDGKVENWAFEPGTPNVWFRRGLTKNVRLPGTKVVVDGYQSKTGHIGRTAGISPSPMGASCFSVRQVQALRTNCRRVVSRNAIDH